MKDAQQILLQYLILIYLLLLQIANGFVLLSRSKRSQIKLSLHASASTVSFSSPLLDEGYVPTVKEFEDGTILNKPLLLYLPGFDGTLVAPFLQFPELSTEFDVWGMEVSMDDRSSVTELCNYVLQFVTDKIKINGNGEGDSVRQRRPLYIMGESFGGILALEVALAIEQRNRSNCNQDNTGTGDEDEAKISLDGLVLINPATCYDKSNLHDAGPPIANGSPILYPFSLMTIIPLFTDDYALPQLIKILQAKGLPRLVLLNFSTLMGNFMNEFWFNGQQECWHLQ